MTLVEFSNLLQTNSDFDANDFGLVAAVGNSEVNQMLESIPAADSSVLFDLLYQHFDGQKGNVPIFGEFELYSLQTSIASFDDYHSEFAHQESDDCRDKRIKDGFLWRAGWFPFALDPMKNRVLVMDFEPSPSGIRGQIFLYDCRQSLGDWIAPDLETFLDSFYAKLVETQFAKDEWLEYQFAARVDEKKRYK